MSLADLHELGDADREIALSKFPYCQAVAMGAQLHGLDNPSQSQLQDHDITVRRCALRNEDRRYGGPPPKHSPKKGDYAQSCAANAVAAGRLYEDGGGPETLDALNTRLRAEADERERQRLINLFRR